MSFPPVSRDNSEQSTKNDKQIIVYEGELRSKNTISPKITLISLNFLSDILFEHRAFSKKTIVSLPNRILKKCFDSSDSRDLASLANTLLIKKLDGQVLSPFDLIDRFQKLMKKLPDTKDSESYGAHFREAEEIVIRLENDTPFDLQNEVSRMRDKLNSAYQNMPVGPGSLTQLDIDHLNRLSYVPKNVICTNSHGEKFLKPEISVDQLQSHFIELGYSKIMHSREVKDFNGNPEVCDVILAGVEESYLEIMSSWSTTVMNYIKGVTSQPVEIECLKLKNYFMNGVYEKLGYKKILITPVKWLIDQEKSARFIEEGFQICVIFFYPQEIEESPLQIGYVNSTQI